MTRRYALIAAFFLLFFTPFPLMAAEDGRGAERYEARHRYHLFETFHKKFLKARDFTPKESESAYWRLLGEGEWILKEINSSGEAAPLNLLNRLADLEVEMAAVAAAKEAFFSRVELFVKRVRLEVKGASRRWPMESNWIAEAIYCALYGGRVALEEATVQLNRVGSNPLSLGRETLSEAPHVTVKGVRMQSGDILLSRGRNAVASLVVRGNRCPGVYSETSIIHVDPESGAATVIGARPYKGMRKISFGDFLVQAGYDALLLRIAPDHPVLQNDPLAPKRAADYAMAKSLEPFPFDPHLDWQDDTRYYGEELLLSAYREEGIKLWPLNGRLNSPGVAEWLRSLGVRNVNVLVPSDLEYDPHLMVVAEWRNIERFRDERLNNAVFDALVDGADMGDRLGYALDEVPLALLVKAWSLIQGYRGLPANVPDGMGAFEALRFRTLTERIHPLLKEELRGAAVWLAKKQGFEPSYWQLVNLAKKAVSNRRPELDGFLKSHAVK